MATLTKEGRQITVPDREVDYYLAQGWNSPGAAKEFARDYPEGDPAQSWKADELKAYAAAHGIDLGAAKRKADFLAALTRPSGTQFIEGMVEGFAAHAREQVAASAAASAELAAGATSED